MRYLTYLIYIILWEGLLFVGIGYAVFVLNHSGWWFSFSVFLSVCSLQPKHWFSPEENE